MKESGFLAWIVWADYSGESLVKRAPKVYADSDVCQSLRQKDRAYIKTTHHQGDGRETYSMQVLLFRGLIFYQLLFYYHRGKIIKERKLKVWKCWKQL